MSLLFNMFSRLVITFLPRSKHLLISWLQSPSAVILEPPQKSLPLFPHLFPMRWWEQMPWSSFSECFKPTFSLSSFTFIKRLFSSSSLYAIKVVSSAYLRSLIFPPAILIPACASSSPVFHMMHSLALPFFGTGMKNDLFQSCGHCWVFHWHIECSTFTASSCRIWNSSSGISSPSLALFIVMLPKAPLTSHSRMSNSRWVITPSWLSGSWRPFFL